MIGNLFRRYRGDVARGPVAEVSFVGRLCVGIPLGGENTTASHRLKAEPNASDAGKEIYDAKAVAPGNRRYRI